MCLLALSDPEGILELSVLRTFFWKIKHIVNKNEGLPPLLQSAASGSYRIQIRPHEYFITAIIAVFYFQNYARINKRISYFMIKKSNKKKEEKETAIQEIVNHYFYSKGLVLKEIKENAKKRKIIYSRFTRPAKQLLELAGSVKKAKRAIDIVAKWANSRNLDYAIETVFKKWLELDRLKPKEIVKKPYFRDDPMIWSETKRKWFVIDKDGQWLEFAGDEKEIKWKIAKK